MTTNTQKFIEAGLKMQAKLFLLEYRKGLITNITEEEWVGLNMLDRDDELKEILRRLKNA